MFPHLLAYQSFNKELMPKDNVRIYNKPRIDICLYFCLWPQDTLSKWLPQPLSYILALTCVGAVSSFASLLNGLKTFALCKNTNTSLHSCTLHSKRLFTHHPLFFCFLWFLWFSFLSITWFLNLGSQRKGKKNLVQWWIPWSETKVWPTKDSLKYLKKKKIISLLYFFIFLFFIIYPTLFRQ